MKKLLLTTAVVALTGMASFGQGYVQLSGSSGERITNVVNSLTQSNLYVGVYYQVIANTNGWESLYTPASFASGVTNHGDPLSLTRGAPLTGVMNTTNVALAGANPNDFAIVQVRAWGAGATGPVTTLLSYEQQVASGTGLQGYYGNLMLVVLGSSVSPTSLANAVLGTSIFGAQLKGFTVAPVPEPSTIALGVLGLLGVLYIRRRK